MYKLYIISLFIISLSVFHQIESSNVTLKSSVKDIDENSYRHGDDINLTCEYKPLDSKEELVSLKIYLKNDIIYDYEERNKNATTHNIDGATKVMEEGLKERKVSVMIHNVTKDIEGEFKCVLEYNKDNKSISSESNLEKITYWSVELKDFDIHIHSDKKEKDFKKGENLSISCKPDVNDPVHLIELEHGNEKIFTYEVKGNHTKHDNKDIPAKEITYKDNSTVEIEIKNINSEMGKEYRCRVTYKSKDQTHIELRKHDIGAVTGIGSILNISYVLIVISLICTRFSYSL